MSEKRYRLDEIIDALRSLGENGEPDTTSLADDVDSVVECHCEDLDIDDALESSGLNCIAADIHSMARAKGWWADAASDEDVFASAEERLDMDRCLIAEKLLMIHSEISEATEELRTAKSIDDLSAVDFADPDDSSKPTGFAVELADTIIRILDLAAFLEIDIENALAEKIVFNGSRPYRHGGKRL